MNSLRRPSAPARLPTCLGCGFVYPDFMLKDKVWIGQLHLPKKDCVYCILCVEDLLSRKLDPDDFLPGAPVNDGIFFGHAMGSRSREALDRHLEFRAKRTTLMEAARKSPAAAEQLATLRAEMQQ